MERNVLENIFRKMCYCRYFELEVVKAHQSKYITNPIYLSTGQEAIPASLSEILKGYYIFAQHRAHSIYLSFGGDPEKLVDELLGLETGCLGGNGGSAMIQDLSINMIGHHGFIGENVPLAVGYALGTGKKTICFTGDGSMEEDYIFPSMGFASTHKLPVLFVCQDNDLSVLTRTKVRRNWKCNDVAKALGLLTIDITDTPQIIYNFAERFDRNLPAFMNIRTCRHNWHVGSGQDGKPEQDTLEFFRDYLSKQGIETKQIEEAEREKAQSLWQQRLQKLSEK